MRTHDVDRASQPRHDKGAIGAIAAPSQWDLRWDCATGAPRSNWRLESLKPAKPVLLGPLVVG